MTFEKPYKPDEYKKIIDVSKYPNLRTKTDKILSD